MKNLLQQGQQLGVLLKQRNLKLTTAESCTGGQLAYIVTAIPGSSNWFERGFVTYSNEAKQEMLGVSNDLIVKHGAVSKEVVLAMAQGALNHSHAQLSVAITGIAGPTGGTTDKPVGTVWIAWQNHNHGATANCYHFEGGRISIRTQAVEQALQGLLQLYSSSDNDFGFEHPI